MSVTYRDRAGNEIERDRWALLMEDRRYQVLRQDHVGPYFVSTIWIGLDLEPIEGEPMIFETMVFKGDSVDTRRYRCEDDALEGHDAILLEVSLLHAAMPDEAIERSSRQ